MIYAKDIQPMMKGIARAMKEFIAEQLAPRDARIAALERQIGEIAQKGIFYRGVFQKAQDYKRGDVVTYEGSMWAAITDTNSAPGKSGDWQLTVKGR